MPEMDDVDVTRQVVISEGTDRSTRLLLWGVFAALLMLGALVAYAWMSGLANSYFTVNAPRSAEERALAVSAEAIRKNPTSGDAYAVRAETLFELGRKEEAYQVLDQGVKAVKGQNPALLFILRAKTKLLNGEGKYAEAEKAGLEAMKASDDYLARQGAALAAKRVTAIGGNLQTRMSVDTAIQLAQAYMGQSKHDKAIEMYDYALELDPLAADVRTLRGYAFLGKGDKAKARADFTETLRFLPDDPDATRGLEQLGN